MKRIMLLGSGELGKEFVIAAKRMGHYVIACDSYSRAPAMQVADMCIVFDMLDPKELQFQIDMLSPDIIVPEIEAIATEVLYDVEASGIQVVPSARAVNLTMNRDAIRDRAYELGLKVARFIYAESKEELVKAVEDLNCKCVVKPVMSSSGKGQSIVDPELDTDILIQIYHSWNYACENMRGKRKRVIVEEFIDFDYEITLLTIVEKTGKTQFCLPIGHIQKNGDYQYSWQPHDAMSERAIADAQSMALCITNDLTSDVGNHAGLFGVEFFVKGDTVYFSELSPRPHDTGMVTMISQNISEFDLHLRAILGLPIPEIKIVNGFGASAVILADRDIEYPQYEGIEEALKIPGVEVRIFGKPTARRNRRMGVVLARSWTEAREAAKKIKVV
jgi:phosphoribosylglycinamide formyltransferase 2